MQRPLGVILERRRRPERSHHRVADELLHRPARPLDLCRHRVIETVEQRARALRVLRAAELGRADEVGKEDRGELPLLRRLRLPFDRRGAARTKARVGREGGSALGAGRHVADCRADWRNTQSFATHSFPVSEERPRFRRLSQ